MKVEWDNPLDGDLTKPVPVHMLAMKKTFCAVVGSDSMVPMLEPDDVVIFREAEFARLGKVVCYRHKDGTVTVKQLRHDGSRPILHALNPDVDDVPADGNVIGILTGRVRKSGHRTQTDFDPEGLSPDF